MYDQLQALGSPISEDDLIHVITNGLGAVYRPFTRSLENRTTDISFDDLYGLLLSEESNLANEQMQKSVVPPTAFYSQSGDFQRQNNNSRGRSNFRQ